MNEAPEPLQIVEREMMLITSWNPETTDWQQFSDPEGKLEFQFQQCLRSWTAVISIYNPMCKHYGYEERLQQFAFTPFDEPYHKEMSRLGGDRNP